MAPSIKVNAILKPLKPLKLTSVDGDKTARLLIQNEWFVAVLEFLSDKVDATRCKEMFGIISVLQKSIYLGKKIAETKLK